MPELTRYDGKPSLVDSVGEELGSVFGNKRRIRLEGGDLLGDWAESESGTIVLKVCHDLISS